jgi:hypothetical protein
VAACTAVGIALVSAACFVGYDSRWGQAKASQQRIAAHYTPGEVSSASADSRAASEHRTYRIRLRPNGHYLSQTVDAEGQLRALVEDADRVLEPTIGLHLEMEKIQPWSFDADDRLEPALTALRTDDPARDVDVVVGLIGALPRPTESLHEVGFAEVLGKHMVVRAASRLGEHDVFDRALADLSEDERDRVVRARRRHRALTVFLHELGHILGALHEADATSVMHPAYDPKMTGFGEGAVALMRICLGGADRVAVARAQLDYVRAAKPASWAPGEREAALARLEAMNPPPAAAAERAPASAQSGPAELATEDRDRFAKALQHFRAGQVAAAYGEAQPLFAAYPASYAVQDLRCQLATVSWLGKDAMLAECAGYSRLADAGGAERH